MSFNSSVCSYPNRGNYGKSSYRGNCTGHIIKDFCGSYLKNGGLLIDPSIGGGTSVDVANELGIDFFGTDLSQGFNLLTDDLCSVVGRQGDAIWWHPPYWNMIAYSGNQWGTNESKWDMSRMNLDDFFEAIVLSIMNIHDATKKGGFYGVLMGNMRKKGIYYNFSSMIERIAPGILVDEIIKIQHNCVSDRKNYNGNFIRIAHEKLLVFRKNKEGAIYFLSKISHKQKKSLKITWRSAIRRILQSGKEMKLEEVYEEIKPYAEQTNNKNWQAKVRQVLQDPNYFEKVERGVYKLNKI